MGMMNKLRKIMNLLNDKNGNEIQQKPIEKTREDQTANMSPQQEGTEEGQNTETLAEHNTNQVKAPTYPVQAEAYPIFFRHKTEDEDKRVNLQDLGTDLCIRMDGSIEGLKSGLKRVVESYRAEMSVEEAEGNFKLERYAIESRQQIIKYNHEIMFLRDDLIPEKQHELKKLEQQIESHKVSYAGTQMPEQMIYEDEVQTTMHLAIARGNELIRRLRARLTELAGAIEQEKLKLDSIEKRQKNIKLMNPNVLKNKLNVFFTGWLSGMMGLNAAQASLQQCHDSFQKFVAAIDEPGAHKQNNTEILAGIKN